MKGAKPLHFTMNYEVMLSKVDVNLDNIIVYNAYLIELF